MAIMKKYKQIYINGDSYSAKTDFKVYGDFLSESLSLPVINMAVPGSNNNRIFRRTIDDLILLEKNTLVIIGLSFITRDELWHEDTALNGHYPDRDKWPDSNLITADFFYNKNDINFNNDRMIDLNINRQLSHFYLNLYMFSKTLENLGFDYIIFSAAHNIDWKNANFTFFNSLNIVKECLTNQKIYKLHEFCFRNLAEAENLECTNTWHLLEKGHKFFSDFLINKFISRPS